MNNYFKIIKEQIDAREFVSHFLREPAKISGENYFWHSPFYEGDNDPSFCASKTEISDFSSSSEFGTGQDIFNFLVKYDALTYKTDMTYYDALNWINENYNLGYDLSSVEENVSIEKVKKVNSQTKMTYSLKVVKNPNKAVSNGIITMFDSFEFSNKPTSDDVKKIRMRTKSNTSMFYSLDEIKKKIVCGQTSIPSGIKSKKNWIDGKSNYQIFMIDFDNATIVESESAKTGKKIKEKINLTIDDDRHVNIEKALAYCEKINLIPTFAYTTMSHSEQQHKFRFVYVLDEPIHSSAEVEGVYKTLKALFRDYYIDSSASDIARLFFGGQDIVFESDKFYKVVSEEVPEETLEESNDSDIKYTELEKECNSYLQYTPYEARHGHLGYITKNDSFVPISNFVPYCINKIEYVNGVDRIPKYEMKCVILDNPDIKLPTLLVDTSSYAKCDFILGSSWDKYCIISAGTGNNSRLREVMQILSRECMNEKKIYTNTGFKRINNNLCYLYHDGVIGNVDNIQSDLSADKLQQYCFTDKEFELADAIKKSLSFLKVADYSITMPILSTIYLAPLKSFLATNDILADFILFIQGQSGTRKSSTVAAAMNHFGSFNRDKFPCSFRDTINSIEKKSFILKDTVNVIDDYNPEIIGSRKLDIVEKLFGMYGDRSGRTRMSQDGQTLKEPYIARGLAIVTGEMLPEVAQSRIARSLIITIKKNSILLDKLSEVQKSAEELAFCMKKFIGWIIDNENSVVEYIKSEFERNKSLQKHNANVHGRTSEIASVLPLGFTLFTLFAEQYGAINKSEKKDLDDTLIQVLNSIVEEQSSEIQELKPTEMFYTAFNELLSTRTICVSDIETKNTFGGGKNVGFYSFEKNLLYLHPNSIYSEICKFYNNKFPLPANALWRYLAEEGFLRQNDKRRYKVARTIWNKIEYVIELDAESLECLKDHYQKLHNAMNENRNNNQPKSGLIGNSMFNNNRPF